MGRSRLALIAFPLLLTLGACSSTTSPTAPTGSTAASLPPTSAVPPTAVATTSAIPSAIPSAASAAPTTSDGPTAVPTSIDPCQVVTAQEASQLTGATFAAGKETTTAGNARICTYGSQTLDVVTVEVAVAPDAATVQTDKAAALAEIQKAAGTGLHVAQLSGIGDAAAAVSASTTISGQTLSITGIYVLKGLVFFAMSDLVLGRPAPTSAAMQAQAQTAIGRLP